jgi:hypothetical protein
MHISGPMDANARSALKALVAAPRRCEKVSDSSALGGKRPDQNGGGEQPPPRLQIQLVSQDETGAFDPFWDGPRLIPAFVAQLMGQSMMPRHDLSAQSTYSSAAPRRAALFDHKS